ncbi:MAG: hypothetical protein NTZ60_01930 [Campylobacterales bacterium]|nr:hypothetical protein [Campylobacterales bacterium]
MNEIFKTFFDRFTNFFTRSVAPSSVFFVVLFFNDKYFNNNETYCASLNYLHMFVEIDKIFLYICLILVFLAYGYINQIFTQLLDEFIKDDYCDSLEFKDLREKVKSNLSDIQNNILKTINYSDYSFYQVLAKDKNIAPSGNYVDEIKALHTVYVALGFNIFITIFIFYIFGHLTILWFPIVLFFYYLLGIYLHKVAKMRYKARNKRLYINYLLEKDKNKTKKEIKIKYRGRSCR